MSAENKNILATPIEYLKGVGPKKGEALRKELEVHFFYDLLHHYPFRYIDKTKLNRIQDIEEDATHVQLRGKISGMSIIGEGRGRRMVATLYDGTGRIELVWFKGINYMRKVIEIGKEYMVYGKPNFYNRRASLPHPEVEVIDGPVSLQNRIQPVYPSTEKLKSKYLESKGIYRLMQNLFLQVGREHLPEYLPDSLIQEFGLMSRYDALRNVHLPANEDAVKRARNRIKFDELFFIQLKLLHEKVGRETSIKGFEFEKLGDNFHNFFEQKLPFELTGAQKRVLKEIRRDTRSGRQMNRLLQGDVGSGKTIVALMSMLMALDNDFQACIMAPTEILAQQHLTTMTEYLEGLDIHVEILTGSIKGKKRRALLDYLELGIIKILIGTHALIEDTVKFKNLGMVVIDEQHRFGVAQRAKLWQKNILPPHILVMTATPIPRTLAMTFYGDLDVSVIDELPPGRKPVQTLHMKDNQRLRVFGFMKQEIEKGRQVYVVYPLISESEHFNYKDLEDGYESISRAFPDNAVSIVHGQMATIDKDYEMQRFLDKETDIMVATTVIEVGVNVPNASVMVIESAERFGLAQLHQLRGRVGRGADQSYCVLMTGDKLSNDGRKRIRAMTETTDGFKIAELDLKLRGPGILDGTQQSGIHKLRIADLTRDTILLAKIRSAVEDLMEDDPNLDKPENRRLGAYMEALMKQQGKNWSRIS